ncbi:MAG: sigma 54-interacting transcriptional regulator [Lachnospiraceae bacterium]|nr:sigma 54-interacting transcriptional regulator [Lachnospiraceae bacterium]
MELNLTKKTIMERGGTLDAFLNALSTPAIIVDRNGLVLFANNKSRSRFYRPDEVGKPILSPQARELVRQTLETGIAQIGAIEILHDQKAYSDIIPIFENDTVIGAFCHVIVMDIPTLQNIVSKLGSTADSKKNMYSSLARNTSKYTFSDFIGQSDAAKSLIQSCKLAASANCSILITGETGCGKEILASAIHSERTKFSNKPFVKINCTAIPRDLIESELFGHEKGAFTGATSVKKGKFEIAEDGTVLLDEIGDMDLNLQSKLLRVLEEHEFERIGGTKLYPLNANVIATTNKNLLQLSEDNLFRPDLYYRLSILEIYIPPLRERQEDIPLLIEHFLKESNSTVRFTKDAMAVLTKFSWPGNVRQLKHFISRASILHPKENIPADTVKQLLYPVSVFQRQNRDIQKEYPVPSGDKNCTDCTDSLETVERRYICQILKQTDGNVAQASSILGITRNTLYNKIKKYGIDTD